MASLTGNSIASTYDSLIKVSDNGVLTSSLKDISDGLGNVSALQLSTVGARINGSFDVANSISGSNLSGTNTGDETNSSIISKIGYTPYNATNPAGYTSNVGTVTSVAITTPTGLTISGSPITSSGTLAIGLQSDYSIPTTSSQTNWDTAFSKRLSAAALSSSTLTLTLADSSTVTASVPSFNQNTTGSAGSVTNSIVLKADSGTTEGTDLYTFNGSSAKTLNIIAGSNITITKAAGQWTIASTGGGGGTTLNGTGFVRMSGTTVSYITGTASQFVKADGSLDSSTYLTSNQSISISGDATGSGTTSIALTLANSGVTASTYRSVTVDAKGRVTAGTNPTTISGYGITDFYSQVVSGFVTGANSTILNTDTLEAALEKLQGQVNARLSANQTITLSGAVTGSGSTAITTTLANSIVGVSNLSATGTPSSSTYLRGDNTWAAIPAGSGTVTSVSVVSANGFAGSVATNTTTPAITLSTTITGLLKGNGTAISAATSGTDYTTPTGTETLTNKRINSRVVTTASTATLTPDVSTGDVFTITAQAASLALANPTGTPTEGQKILIRIKDNGTARSIAFSGTQYRASSDLAFPTTTIVNKTMYLGFIYNATDTKWDMIAKIDNF